MSGGAEHGKKDAHDAHGEHKKADAGHGGAEHGGGHGAKSRPGLFRTAGDLFKGVAQPIAAVGGFFGRRIRGFMGGLWGSSVGQTKDEAREIGHRTGYKGRESDGPASAITGLNRSIWDKVGKVASGTVDWVVTLPARLLDRAVHGVEHSAWKGAAKGERYKGREATRHDEESAAHDAGAHGAH